MTGSKSHPKRVHFGLATVSILFGLSYVLTKFIINDVPPQAWAFYRVVIAATTLLPFVLKARIGLALRRPRLWFSGFFGIALNQLLFAEGLKRTTPSHSALINACIPAITLIFSLIAAREVWNTRRAAGIALAILGVLVLVGHPEGGALLGDALTLANVISFSFFFVISQPLAKEYPPLALTGLYLLVGVLVLGLSLTVRTVIDPSSGLLQALTSAPLKLHLLMIFVAIQSTTITYTLNNWALKRATPSQVAAYITLQPIIATLMSAMLLGEKLGASFIPAFMLVTAGVFLSAVRASRKPTLPAKAACS